jgi:hypothetical protein
VSFNVNTNPFQDAYLFRLDVKKNPPPSGGQKTGHANKTGGANNGPPVMDDYIRDAQRKKALNDRKNSQSDQKNGNMNAMVQKLYQRQQEVNGLKREVLSVNEPSRKKILEADINSKSAGTIALNHDLNSSYNASGGGFVGSEGRVDYVGSFVTFG